MSMDHLKKTLMKTFNKFDFRCAVGCFVNGIGARYNWLSTVGKEEQFLDKPRSQILKTAF
jgi:hypothetical protein